jgi:Uma2 family endonuclease
VAQYHEMIRTGILTDDDPVELLEGWLVPKMPKNPAHRIATRQTRMALENCVGPGWYVDSQEPVTFAESEPEPDVMAVRGEPEDYRDRHPGGSDLGLAVEISDTTLARDRGAKKRAYAQARVPVYWIVNLLEQHVEVYTEPTGAGDLADYLQRQDFGVGDEVPVVLDGQEVARVPVRALLP